MNSNLEDNIKLEQKNRRAYLFSLVGVLTLVVAIIGTTYAFFQLTATNDNINGSAAEVGLDLVITKIAPDTQTIDSLVPQKSSNINTVVNSECNDNNNTVCQLYRLNLANIGSTPITISGTIAFNGIENMPNLKWSTGTVIYNEDPDGLMDITDPVSNANFSTTGTTASADATSLGSSLTINAGTSNDVYLVVWIEEIGELQYDTGTFTAIVNYASTEGQGVTSTIIS